METGIRCSIPANTKDTGEFVLPCSTFSDILKKLPEGEVLVEVEQDEVTITAGYSVFNIIGIAAESYPPVNFQKESFCFSMDQKTLRSMILQTVFSVSQSDSKPVHTGCLFHLEGDELEVVGVDGYRLAIRREKLQVPVEQPLQFVVPGQDAARALAHFDRQRHRGHHLALEAQRGV